MEGVVTDESAYHAAYDAAYEETEEGLGRGVAGHEAYLIHIPDGPHNYHGDAAREIAVVEHLIALHTACCGYHIAGGAAVLLAGLEEEAGDGVESEKHDGGHEEREAHTLLIDAECHDKGTDNAENDAHIMEGAERGNARGDGLAHLAVGDFHLMVEAVLEEGELLAHLTECVGSGV